MHDCYQLGIIDHDTLTSFLRFCVQFWMDHYRMKKQQQFDMSEQEIENEKKRLAAISAQREVWERSPARAVEKATEQIEELGEQLDRDLEEDTAHPPLSHQPRGTSQQPTTASRTANLSLEDMMA